MHILFLAPHPFFQERGTPIAVRLLLEEYSRRGHTVDLATFSEGAAVELPGLRIHRTAAWPGLAGVRPGFSLKKLVSDVLLFFLAARLIRQRRPDVIHAVEESCFIGLFFKRLKGIPFVYDMDSSMPDQIVEKAPLFGFLRPLMHAMVGCAAGAAVLVAPVCDALEETSLERYRARKTVMLRDISLLRRPERKDSASPDHPADGGTRFLYIGNLEGYQGIDLMLDAFAEHCRRRPADTLIVAGGPAPLVAHYRTKAAALGLGDAVRFLGPRPVSEMADLFDAADVLVSPRTKGNNTPMKLYSYLESGRAILATRLPTHTQVIDDTTAQLAEPEPRDFARAMTQLSEQPALRSRLAAQAAELARTRYSHASFDRAVTELCTYVAAQIAAPAAHEPQPV